MITNRTMERLVESRPGPCVSVYMPTHRYGRETAQDPIRLGNLLDRAHDELQSLGMRQPEAAELLARARRLTDEYTFWQHQEDGLALFVEPGASETFRLPMDFTPLVTVGDAFHVKPLWPLVSGHDLFHVLALSRNEVRLLWADRFRVGEIDLPDDIPESLAQALWFEDPEKQLQQHGADRVAQGRVVATFHGHGGPDDKDDARLETFLRAVDRGLSSIIDASAPLVLAGVDELTAHFRRVSRHPTIARETVSGNPEMAAPQSLHSQAVAVVAPRRRRALDDDVASFHAAGDLAVSTIREAVPAALAGRMAFVFLPIGVQVWGMMLDGDGSDVEVHDQPQPGDRDLTDLVGVATWTKSGVVHAVAPDDVPEPGPLAGVLRY